MLCPRALKNIHFDAYVSKSLGAKLYAELVPRCGSGLWYGYGGLMFSGFQNAMIAERCENFAHSFYCSSLPLHHTTYCEFHHRNHFVEKLMSRHRFPFKFLSSTIYGRRRALCASSYNSSGYGGIMSSLRRRDRICSRRWTKIGISSGNRMRKSWTCCWNLAAECVILSRGSRPKSQLQSTDDLPAKRRFEVRVASHVWTAQKCICPPDYFHLSLCHNNTCVFPLFKNRYTICRGSGGSPSPLYHVALFHGSTAVLRSTRHLCFPTYNVDSHTQ